MAKGTGCAGWIRVFKNTDVHPYLLDKKLVVASINIILGVAAGIYALKRKHARAYMLSLFFYITFHYTYSVFAIFDVRAAVLWRRSTQPGVKIVGLLFIIFILVELYRRYVFKHLRWTRPSITIAPIILSGIWLLFTFVQWALEIVAGHAVTRVMLQETVSSVLMLLLILGFCAAMKANPGDQDGFWKSALPSGTLISVVMFLVASYQIVFLKTFAAGILPNGERVQRACAFLYNPNVLGFWASLMLFFVSYGYHSGRVRLKDTLLLMLVLGMCILLSGSRSCAVITGVFLVLPTAFLVIEKKGAGFWKIITPAMVLSVESTLLLGVIKIMERLSAGSIAAIHNMSLLVDRFLSIPYLVFFYLGSVLQTHFPRLAGFLMGAVPGPQSYTSEAVYDSSSFQNAANVYVNIDQRMGLSSGLADNGFLAVYETSKWFGLLPWCLLWVALGWFGLRAFYLKPDVHSSYAVSAIFGCAFAALGMRLFQVFPFWIMVALCLGPAIYWIFAVTEKDEAVQV